LKVVFLGVGEAYDENLINNSHIIFSQKNLLLDCGYSVPRHLWRNYPDKNFLDAVYLSHAHMDHYMGTPILLARMRDEKRTKPLVIICQPEIRENLIHLTNYAHANLSKRINFPIEFIEVNEDSQIFLSDLRLEFAPTNHSIKNLAVKIHLNNKTICYSGDGDLTNESINLYRKADLLIHEAFTLERVEKGHASIKNVLEKCGDLEIKNLALTHLNRGLRKNMQVVIDFIKLNSTNINVFIPEPLDELIL
jgi:ribonuclease Z